MEVKFYFKYIDKQNELLNEQFDNVHYMIARVDLNLIYKRQWLNSEKQNHVKKNLPVLRKDSYILDDNEKAIISIKSRVKKF